MSIISQLPVVDMPTNVNSTLTMDKRFGVIQVGDDLIQVPMHIILGQTITEIQNSDEPLVEVPIEGFFAEWKGELHNCRGKRVPRLFVANAKTWQSDIARATGVKFSNVPTMCALKEPWKRAK